MPASLPSNTADRDFADAQRAYWSRGDAAHFAWATSAPYFAGTEAALLDGVTAPVGGTLLEIGCGEGVNLHHLAARLPSVRLVGVDYSPGRARFTRERTGCATAVADATRLPFADAAFDAVLIRDLLHHLPRSARVTALGEAARVLRPGGGLFLVEPNAWNPLIALSAAVQPAERGMLHSRAGRLAAEVAAAGFDIRSTKRRQPMPISRLVLHPRFGLPRLANSRIVQAALGGFERAAARLPDGIWAYLLLAAIKPPARDGGDR